MRILQGSSGSQVSNLWYRFSGIFITDFRGFFFLSNLSTTDFEMEFVLNVEIFPVAGNAVSKYDVAAALTRLHFVSFRSNLSPIYLYNE